MPLQEEIAKGVAGASFVREQGRGSWQAGVRTLVRTRAAWWGAGRVAAA